MLNARHVIVGRARVIAPVALCLTSLGMGLATDSMAASSRVPQRLFLGECALGTDPLEEQSESCLPALCVRASTGIVGQQSIGDTDVGTGQAYARVYGGLHLISWLSAHGEARAGWRRTSPHEHADKAWVTENVPEQLMIRVGNPAWSRWRVSAGRVQIPFGVNLRPLPPVFDQWTSRRYWEGLPYGVRVTWDDQIGSLIETAVVQGSDARVYQGPQRALYRGFAVRASHDLSALEGIRMLGSYYANDAGERRVGVGLLNVNNAKDATNIEIIRVRHTPDGLAREDGQLIRLAFVGAFRRGNRWALEYDDQRKVSRMGTLGLDTVVHRRVLVRTALSYSKSERAGEKSFWVGTAGVEARL